jgi:hypothetical protein
MSVTPKLSTAITSRIEREQRRMQTAFPAKVVSYSASTNVVTVTPQFIETWFTRDYERTSEEGDAQIENVPVCFPRHISWTVDSGDFGLVICTKYSLDVWRNRRTRVDPGDLRRFTMAGATFHPVLMDETPDPTQQFVALANLVKSELDAIQTTFESITVGTGGGGEVLTPYVAGSVAASKVKAT